MKFKSQVYTAVSGSVGGLTYAHNKYGMYTRGRAMSVNKNSTRQMSTRAAFTAMVIYWSVTLTSALRAAWENYAQNTPVTDALGQSQVLSGQAMFIRANSIRQRLGLSIITAAPLVFNTGQPVVSITSITVLAGVLTGVWNYGGLGTSAAGRKLVSIGVAQNPGRTFFKGPWQLAFQGQVGAGVLVFTTSPGVTLASANWLAAYQPKTGDLLPVKIQQLYDDGRLSLPFQQIVTVA